MAIVPLSPVDHFFTGKHAYSIELLFVYDQQLDADRMATSLKAILPNFGPLNSTLTVIDEYSLGLKQTDQGCRFSTRQLEVDPDLNNHAELYQLIDYVESVPGEPLAKILLTTTPTKSYLGISISHAAADGYSYFFFLACWARQTRGEEIYPPTHNRSVLIPEVVDSGVTPSEQDIFWRTGLSWGETRRGWQKEELNWQVILLSQSEIKELLSEGNDSNGAKLSNNDLLTAYLWQRYAPQVVAEEKLSLTCAFDYRRIHPELSPLFFGNAVQCAIVQLTAERLQKQSLAETATLIRDAVNAIDLQRVKDTLLCLAQLRLRFGLNLLQKCHVLEPQKGFFVTNMSRIPVSELNFGNGAPKQIKICTMVPNTATILPRLDGGSGLELQVCRPVSRG